MRVQLQGVLLDDSLTPTEASALAGKMQFVAQSLFGKGRQSSLKTLYKRTGAGRFRSPEQGWAPGLGLYPGSTRYAGAEYLFESRR